MEYFAGLIFLAVVAMITTDAQPNPDHALKKLKEGNRRFVQNKLSNKNYSAQIKETSDEQKPYAIIVACSDSRVAPEIIFDESIGKLFVIRLAGNVIDSAAIGSIDFAVKYLNLSYLLILGHTNCGAVTATLSGKDYSPSITKIAKMIAPAYEKVKGMGLSKEEEIERTVKENVYLQASIAAEKSDIISEYRDSGKLKIGGAVYDIKTGQVNFFE